MENARLPQLELLDTICERCPPLEARGGRTDFIQVSCPHHISHLVSPLGFLLLEEVEQALGSAKQEVERSSVHFLDEHLVSALSSILSVSSACDDSLKMLCFLNRDKNDAEALHTLAQRCQNVNLEEVNLEEAEEEDAAEGWAALAKALHLCPGFESVEVSRRVMLIAERRDLRTI